MSVRKPVQFQYVYGCGDWNGYVVMADDGTFWRSFDHHPERDWRQIDLPPLPQPTAPVADSAAAL